MLPLAVALSGLFSVSQGIGTGLPLRPGFRADFVPWHTGRMDAHALVRALGVGVLGSLAEDDLDRTRAALLSLPGTALAMTLVLGASAPPTSTGPPDRASA